VAAGNDLADIAALASEAHLYRARVYATLNTLLTDAEMPRAVELIHDLWGAGVDAVIVQDLGLLEHDLPPVPLHASTQTHAMTPARVRFLADLGFERVILARELSLAEIRVIRGATEVDLEVFVHGALCVSWSGQCWMSHHRGGRSANRGACAQPCRLPWTLEDERGRVLAADEHLLSLADLDRSHRLGDLLDAGVTSLKIEGRLKGPDYVTNAVAHYSALLDAAVAERGLRRASSGRSSPGFDPDPRKSFSRGATDFRLDGHPTGSLLAWPTSTGEPLGRVLRSSGPWLTLEHDPGVRPGDGLCFEVAGDLRGATVDQVVDDRLVLRRAEAPPPGVRIWRNRDIDFRSSLASARPRRTLSVTVTVHPDHLHAEDEDGHTARVDLPETEPARDAFRAREILVRQLSRAGGTAFSADEVCVLADPPPFLPVGRLNALRRDLLERLHATRSAACPRQESTRTPHPTAPHPEVSVDYRANILNRWTRALYERCGVEAVEPAAESGEVDLSGRPLMTSHHCIRRELGTCLLEGGEAADLSLVDSEGRRYPLRFDCKRCLMEVLAP